MNTTAGTGRVSLDHTPERTVRSDGYTRLARIGVGHTAVEGMAELPEFTTFYQVDHSKTYDFINNVANNTYSKRILVINGSNF